MTPRFTFLLLLTSGLHSIADDAKPAGFRTISSSGVTSAGMGENSYGVSSASLLTWDGRAIACYGITKARKDDARYSYFFLFKAPAEMAGKSTEIEFGGAQSMAEKIEAKESPTILFQGEKRRWKYSYKLEANRDLTKVTTETLTIDGKEINTCDARVFLVDLTQEKPTAKAIKVAMPKSVPDLDGKVDALEIVAKAIDELKASSTEVKEFLESSAKKK